MPTVAYINISGYGVVTAYNREEHHLLEVVRDFLERGELRSCTELLAALELLRKRRSIYIAMVLDDRLARVIEGGACHE